MASTPLRPRRLAKPHKDTAAIVASYLSNNGNVLLLLSLSLPLLLLLLLLLNDMPDQIMQHPA